jgi:predicted Zn-dependent protease with MMP-like domain
VDQKLRDFFDLRLERVLGELPEWLIKLLDEVPLHVEDYPSDETLARLGIAHRGNLCGLHTGMPLVERKVLPERSGWEDPNTITIYREGIMNLASSRTGQLSERELLRQIRITVLHELGHYHGLNEDDLSELGYG